MTEQAHTSKLAELVVIGFKGTQRAAEVLDQLRGMNAELDIELEDAVAIYRTKDGKLRMDQSVQATAKEGATWGAFMGGLIGAVLAAPFTAGASVPAAAAALAVGGLSIGATIGGVLGATDAAEWKEAYGISDAFVKEAGGMVQPGHSAVFMLVRAYDPADVIERFRGYGGRVLRTTLSPDAAAKLQATLSVHAVVHQSYIPASNTYH